MANQQAIETHREGAEIYYGDVICKQKSLQLLSEIDLPSGLLPLEDITEVGYNRASGFVWLKQKKSVTHLFRNIDKNVSYGQEITAFAEKHRLKKLTGVKAKELLLWVTIGDMYIDENDSDKIVFKNPITGISKAFPVSAFEEDDGKKKEEVAVAGVEKK